MSAESVARRYTPEEYLEMERRAEVRSEYYNGRIYAMSGGTLDHARITRDIANYIEERVAPRGCETFTSDVRVKILATGLYTYPDVCVVCGEAQLEDDRRDSLLNPIAIAEVLSPSSEAHVRGEKFAHYRRIESLQEYVLVAQDRMRMELFTRRNDIWVFTEAAGPDGVLRLESLDIDVPLSAVYRRVEVPASELH